MPFYSTSEINPYIGFTSEVITLFVIIMVKLAIYSLYFLYEAILTIMLNLVTVSYTHLTGDMSKSRAEMRATAIRYGADSPTSISGKTNMLVIGEEVGKSKVEKAKQLGIEIITEQEFWDIINKEASVE